MIKIKDECHTSKFEAFLLTHCKKYEIYCCKRPSDVIRYGAVFDSKGVESSIWGTWPINYHEAVVSATPVCS